MALSLKQFVQQLEDSGILAGDTLKDFIPPKASPKDVSELARELIRQKKLTKYQAEEVYRGKAKSLVLGNYVLIEKIGAGGMGLVFKAEHRRMHRTVAIKLLPPHMTKDAAAIARFEREVTAAAKLRHSNIVAADDADCANGVHFLVMEMVEGNDLSALVKKNGPFSVEKAVNYVLQAAKGLEFAHHEGVVHRDIKPANLLLDKKGVVKILDMGLARLNGNVDTPKQAELTSTGMLMGTVDYMAPEQALNTKMADARADIYALGCSLYYLLTGKATYDGDSLMAKLLAHRDQTIPSLSAVRSEVPEQVEAVFKKRVAKTVQDRYQTMAEVIVELERCMVSSPTSVSLQQPATTAFEDGTFNFLKKPHEKRSMLAKPPQKSATGKSGSGKHRFALIGAAFVGIAILGGIIVSLQTKDGTLIVQVDQPDANVQVLDAEGKVEISQKGGKTPLKAKLVPLEEKPAMAGTKPAVVVATKKPLPPAWPSDAPPPAIAPFDAEQAKQQEEEQRLAVEAASREQSRARDDNVSQAIARAVEQQHLALLHAPLMAMLEDASRGLDRFAGSLTGSPVRSGFTSPERALSPARALSPLRALEPASAIMRAVAPSAEISSRHRERPPLPVDRVWATILAQEVLKEFDCSWLLVDDTPTPWRTVVDGCAEYLRSQAKHDRRLRKLLKSGELEEAADKARTDWKRIQAANVLAVRDADVINKFTALTHLQRASARVVRSVMTDHGKLCRVAGASAASAYASLTRGRPFRRLPRHRRLHHALAASDDALHPRFVHAAHLHLVLLCVP